MGKENIRILELFSGIGGMHYAFKRTGIEGSVVAAVDINQIANHVYSFNHPEIKVMNNNIQKLCAKSIVNELNPNVILMSPPCQPFTRVGNKKDVDDARTDALKHICDIMPSLHSVQYILLENVKGFETSKARDLYTERLTQLGFDFREFILSPSQLGVPNTRYRYYCLASRKEFDFDKNEILKFLPSYLNSEHKTLLVKDILEDLDPTEEESYRIPDKCLRKRAWLMDIVYPNSKNTICFTKAYTHFAEGTGSVYTSAPRETVTTTFQRLETTDADSDTYIQLLKALKLRYFTPREVARLMSFPEYFQFPDDTTRKQRYRLLGNSINVLLVSKLIELLLK